MKTNAAKTKEAVKKAPAHLIEGNHSVRTILNIKELRSVYKQFSLATGFTTGLVSYPDQEILIRTGWGDICTNFHRANPDSVHYCIESNIQLTKIFKTPETININPCFHGLIDGATPIIINNKHIANLFTGQVFFKQPDINWYRKHGKNLGYNIDAYIKAIEKVPVVTEPTFKNALTFLKKITTIILELNMINLSHIETVKQFKAECSAHTISESRYKAVFDTSHEGILVADIESRRFLHANPSICKMLGYAENELKKMRVLDIHPKESMQKVISQFESQASGKKRISTNVPCLRKDGKIIFMNIVSSPSVSIDGKKCVIGFFENVTEQIKAEKQILCLNKLKKYLLSPAPLSEKAKQITNSVIEIFDADFARIWHTRPGDLCNSGCVHSEIKNGPHVCRLRNKCLHLISSSGRYTHIDGKVHRRVPFGGYKIGRIASGKDRSFLTNDVTHNDRVHNHKWANELGLVSFAGCKLTSNDRKQMGVLAFFSKHIVSKRDEAFLETIADTASQVIQTAIAEDALRESELKYRNLVEKANDGICIVLNNESICFANQKLSDIIGLSLDKIVNTFFKRFINSENLPSFYNKFRLFMSGEEISQLYDTVLIDATHNKIDVELNISETVFRGERAALILVRDISERKKSENELIRLRNLLGNIINSMPSTLIAVDKDLKITQWNIEAEIFTGLKHKKAIGCTFSDCFPQLSSHIDAIRNSIFSNKTHKDIKITTEINKETRYLNMTVYPLSTDNLTGAVIRVDDVTERVLLELIMIQSEKMISVGGLAAGMAHEINNPLAGIMQNSQVIRNRLSSKLEKNNIIAKECGTTIDAIERYLEKRNITKMFDSVTRSCNRASLIVKEILNFSRKSESAFVLYDLGSLIDNAIELITTDYVQGNVYNFRGIEIARKYDPSTPEVPCQSSQIQQVFLNILNNGAYAMSEGLNGNGLKPKFIIQVKPDGDMVKVEIQDNGPGMNEKTAKRIFEPFYTTKDVGVGTGLGLSISYFIITKNHSGTMTVDSAQGKGTKFTVRLPLKANSNS
ncbi:MAG: PAS domain S-box protein [Candidatus Theseobacter exili]|nr:PAS domain S-box protein [Candidatus Theseobacter exili]